LKETTDIQSNAHKEYQETKNDESKMTYSPFPKYLEGDGSEGSSEYDFYKRASKTHRTTTK
jgi:hypothetical protein